ncbi:hypothetical protein L2E82_24341 [Cichorium intybus]|uniref:Uncharacterized protein n=1 Tax=Cichorium intybus TaxID=13427 RepID=A0ACB9E0X2_CICIN|nr:hypothetical protein L2E82_24341 [Cichorium intybus]
MLLPTRRGKLWVRFGFWVMPRIKLKIRSRFGNQRLQIPAAYQNTIFLRITEVPKIETAFQVALENTASDRTV